MINRFLSFTVCMILIMGQSLPGYASEVAQPSSNQHTANLEQEYLSAIAKRFRRNYFPLPDYCNCVAKVKFLIDAKGHVSKIQVVKSPVRKKSQVTSYDNDKALIAAVENLSELPSMPSQLSPSSQIMLTLDGRGDGPMKITAKVISGRALTEK